MGRAAPQPAVALGLEGAEVALTQPAGAVIG